MMSQADQEAMDSVAQQWWDCTSAIIKRSAELGPPWSRDRAGAIIAILAQAGYTFIKYDDLEDDGVTPKAVAKELREALEALRDFREMWFANVTQANHAASHHNPIWERVADILDRHGMN